MPLVAASVTLPRIAGRLKGKAAIYSYLKNVQAQIQDLKFTNLYVYPTMHPNVLCVEGQESVITSTGRSYQQIYVIRLETRKGKIIHLRYWSPMLRIEVQSLEDSPIA